MSYAPQRAPEHARERIGGFMGTVLVGGLFAGATSSFLLVPLAKSFWKSKKRKKSKKHFKDSYEQTVLN